LSSCNETGLTLIELFVAGIIAIWHISQSDNFIVYRKRLTK